MPEGVVCSSGSYARGGRMPGGSYSRGGRMPERVVFPEGYPILAVSNRGGLFKRRLALILD